MSILNEGQKVSYDIGGKLAAANLQAV